MTRMTIFALAAGLALTPALAHANLIMNGSFEQTAQGWYGEVHGHDLATLTGASPGWDVYDALPGGWTSPITPTNAGIELHSSGTVVPAQHGDFYAELDSDRGSQDFETNSTMQQIVALDPGRYRLSFFYRPRTNNDGIQDNRIDLEIFGPGGALGMLTADAVTSDFDEWRQYDMWFSVANMDSYTVQFSAGGAENTFGGFIDTVSLMQVPAPATLGFLGLGLIGLAAARRR